MSDDPNTYPTLGRLLLWVDKPGSANKIFWGLAVLCAAMVLIGFTFEYHGHFHMEGLPGFFAVFGFVAFTLVILGAKALRVLIKRPEDFYADMAVDGEEYPTSGLEKVDHDA